jgi:hypothetical protein
VRRPAAAPLDLLQLIHHFLHVPLGQCQLGPLGQDLLLEHRHPLAVLRGEPAGDGRRFRVPDRLRLRAPPLRIVQMLPLDHQLALRRGQQVVQLLERRPPLHRRAAHLSCLITPIGSHRDPFGTGTVKCETLSRAGNPSKRRRRVAAKRRRAGE